MTLAIYIDLDLAAARAAASSSLHVIVLLLRHMLGSNILNMCDVGPNIWPNSLIVILWKRSYLIYANEGERPEPQRVSTFYMACIVLNYNRANGNICTMKCSF